MQHKPSPYMRRFRLPQLRTFTVPAAPISAADCNRQNCSTRSKSNSRLSNAHAYSYESNYLQSAADLHSPTSDNDEGDFIDSSSVIEAKLGLIALENKELRERKMYSEVNAASSSSSGSHSSLGSAGTPLSPAYWDCHYLNERGRSKSYCRPCTIDQTLRRTNLLRDTGETFDSDDYISFYDKTSVLPQDFQLFKRLNRRMRRLNLADENKKEEFKPRNIAGGHVKGNRSTNCQRVGRPELLQFNLTSKT